MSISQTWAVVSKCTLIPHRQSNIALLQNYGPNAWRVHNYLLEATSKNLDKSLEELKELTVEVNRYRKNFQVCSLLSLALLTRDSYLT